MSILFIRHAATEMAGRFCGHSDPELNAEGQRQLVTLIDRLAPETIRMIYSSDLRRARDTAEAVATARDIPVVVRPALREIDFGQWEGLEWEQIERIDSDYAQRWMAAFPHLPAPSGESFQAFTSRVLEEVQFLIDEREDHIAVVTHAGVLRVILQHLCGCSESEAWQSTKAYCCVVQYQPEAIGERQ